MGEILLMLFNIAVTLCFLVMMLYILRAHIGAGIFIGLIAAIIGFIWGPEGGLVLYGKWGFIGGVGLILLMQIKETFKILFGGLLGVGVGCLINWPLHLSPDTESSILCICIMIGIGICSSAAAQSMTEGWGSILSAMSSNGSSSAESTGGGSSSSSPDNPIMPHYQQPEGGNTCMYCKYFDANSCTYYDSLQYVNPNSRACWNFS